MSKQKYLAPTLEVIDAEEKDVIATSTDEFDGEWVTTNNAKTENAYAL